jgi:hypothetical protein
MSVLRKQPRRRTHGQRVDDLAGSAASRGSSAGTAGAGSSGCTSSGACSPVNDLSPVGDYSAIAIVAMKKVVDPGSVANFYWQGLDPMGAIDSKPEPFTPADLERLLRQGSQSANASPHFLDVIAVDLDQADGVPSGCQRSEEKSAARIGVDYGAPAGTVEGLPVPFGLSQAVGHGVDDGGMMAHAAMAARDLDTL